MEYDGFVYLKLRIDAEKERRIEKLRLAIPWRKEHAWLASGMGYSGKRDPNKAARFDTERPPVHFRDPRLFGILAGYVLATTATVYLHYYGFLLPLAHAVFVLVHLAATRTWRGCAGLVRLRRIFRASSVSPERWDTIEV